MKKITILLLLSLIFSTSSFSQISKRTKGNADKFEPEFRIAVGVNAVQNLGTREPFTDIDEWSFGGLPLSAAFEYKFAQNWSVEQALNFNKFDTGLDKESFFGTNTNLKWYPHWLKSEKVKLFANAGLGLFKIEDLTASANLGGGIIYWFSDYFGVRGSALNKFAFKTDKKYDNNHFQCMLEVIFKL